MHIINTKTHKYLFLSLVITCLVLVARDVFLYEVPNTILLVVLGVLMFIMPYTTLVSFIYFMIPLTCGIPGYMMLLAIVMLVVKGKSWTSRQLFPVIIVGILEVINELGRTPDTMGVLSFMSFIAVFFYLLNLDGRKVDNGQNVICYIVGVAFTIGVVYYNMLSQYGIEGLLTGYYRSGALGSVDNDAELMKGHLAANANTIAYYAICAISTAIVCIKSLPYNKWLMSALIFVCFLGGIFTFSRTFILCIALFLILFIFFQDYRSTGIFVIIAMAIAVLAIAFWGEYINDLLGVFGGRAEEENIATGGGRTELFTIYNKLWGSDIFYIVFGCGAVDYWHVLKAPNASHCGLQQIWVCLGIIGLALFMYEVFSYLKRFSNKNNFIMLVPFLVSFLFDQSVQFLNPYSLLLPIVPTLIVCQLQFQKTL